MLGVTDESAARDATARAIDRLRKRNTMAPGVPVRVEQRAGRCPWMIEQGVSFVGGDMPSP
jgi:hypothetical protein